ncbi:MAG: DUF5702 domain-containing protein [Eubacteriaceae bacterium]|nr:DUF5702 domain-containing protein [Eubacteriaceae bacterium]
MEKTVNRKGSSSIFLIMILAGMMAVTFGFIAASQKIAAISYGDALMSLAGRSVLSEYDRDLKKDYGIFAFRGQQHEINEEMSRYVNYTLDLNDKVKMTGIACDTSEYSLANTETFQREIIEYTKYAIARGYIKDILSSSGSAEHDGAAVDTEKSDRVLRSQSVKSSLPSGAVAGSGNLLSTVKNAIGEADQVFRKGSDAYLMNRYIMSHFKNGSMQDLGRETFFKYEAEYIIEGEMDDNSNRKSFRNHMLLLRNAVNFAFIYTDPEMRTELTAAAQLITPGPGGIATQLVLAEAWALAEAENDMQLLEHGKKVPIYKTKKTWAVDLDSIVKNKETKYIDTHCSTGFTYEGYLQIFLFFMDKDTKYGRMMDLMQINIMGTGDSTFLIKEHNAGFRVNSTINGRKYSYDQEY